LGQVENSGKEKETKRLSKKRLYGITLAVIIFSAAFIYFSWHSPANQTFQLKAVIVDQAAVTYPNPDVITNFTSILEEAGYTVDYYGGGEVTVEFYRNLPKQGYGIVVIRTHSRPTGICTGELYEKSNHVYEQLTSELTQIFVDGESYFGITASFIKNSMSGRFRNSTILMMGCDGLSDTSMAEAFIEKGAKVYIGWKESLMSNYTDTATELLLKHIITENQTIEQAVNETMKEMGPYPVLAYYPPEAGTMVIREWRRN
jgi:hypothetical protein